MTTYLTERELLPSARVGEQKKQIQALPQDGSDRALVVAKQEPITLAKLKETYSGFVKWGTSQMGIFEKASCPEVAIKSLRERAKGKTDGASYDTLKTLGLNNGS